MFSMFYIVFLFGRTEYIRVTLYVLNRNRDVFSPSQFSRTKRWKIDARTNLQNGKQDAESEKYLIRR